MVGLYVDTLQKENKKDTMNIVSVASFNCKGMQSAEFELRELCSTKDIICLQETWLDQSELSLFNTFDTRFHGIGVSPVDPTQGLLKGRKIVGVGSFGTIVYLEKTNRYQYLEQSDTHSQGTCLVGLSTGWLRIQYCIIYNSTRELLTTINKFIRKTRPGTMTEGLSPNDTPYRTRSIFRFPDSRIIEKIWLYTPSNIGIGASLLHPNDRQLVVFIFDVVFFKLQSFSNTKHMRFCNFHWIHGPTTPN